MPGSEQASNTNYRRRPMWLAKPALLNLRAVGVRATVGGLVAAPVFQAAERAGCTVACATADDLYGSLAGIVHYILLVSFSASCAFKGAAVGPPETLRSLVVDGTQSARSNPERLTRSNAKKPPARTSNDIQKPGHHTGTPGF